MNHRPKSQRERGFSLLELMVVVAIIMVIAAMMMPRMLNVIQQYRLRSAASQLAGLAQKARMMAVAQNRYYALLSDFSGSTIWIKLDTNTVLDPPERVNSLQPPRGVSLASSGWPPFPITNLVASGTLLTVNPGTEGPGFTARGLPCVSSTTTCTPTGAYYIYYLRQDRSLGAAGWAAVTVTPAGRVRVWTWTGSAWQ